MPIAPNATGAVLTIRHSPAAYSGLKQADQQCGGNCYRCAKAGGSFKESAETETDNQHLQTLVRGYRKNRRANDVKLPGFHRDL